jgi:hypothetical protein
MELETGHNFYCDLENLKQAEKSLWHECPATQLLQLVSQVRPTGRTLGFVPYYSPTNTYKNFFLGRKYFE